MVSCGGTSRDANHVPSMRLLRLWAARRGCATYRGQSRVGAPQTAVLFVSREGFDEMQRSFFSLITAIDESYGV